MLSLRADKNNEIERVRGQYTSGKKSKHSHLDPEQKLALLLDNIGTPKKLLKNLKAKVLSYAAENLNQVGSGNNYTTEEANIGSTRKVAPAKKSTHPNRAKAVTLILEKMANSSIDSLYDYVTTTEFSELAGLSSISLNLLRENLAKPINVFIGLYKEFLELDNTDLLLDILLCDEIVITNEQLSLLFLHYNSKLVADIIVHVYADANFSFNISHGSVRGTFNYETLTRLLESDKETTDYLNEIRCFYRTPLLWDANTVSPGRNTLIDDNLTANELYQYDDLTILAIEGILRAKYASLLVNNFSNLDVPRDLQAPYYFYQISAAEYMLLNPSDENNPRYFRYENLKRDLTSLVGSYDPTHPPHGKPLIFFGILNFDSTHYVPYFIHKNNQSQIQVIIVDPSPRMYPSAHIRLNVRDDGKVNAKNKLSHIFQDLFPGCKVFDPEVTQMLRERDCGPNAATTLNDALASLNSSLPLLTIVDNKLAINPEALTVKTSPAGIDPYTKMFMYPGQIVTDSLQSRANWASQLFTIDAVSGMTIRTFQYADNLPKLITDEYNADDQITQEYSYRELIANQQRQDLREINISVVQSLLLRNPAEREELITKMVASYKKSLKLPKVDDLEQFIKEKVTDNDELASVLSAHNGNIHELAEDVCTFILRDYIPDSLISIFNENILNNLSFNTDLNATNIVDTFLAEHAQVYKKTSLYLQSTIKSRLLSFATEGVKQVLTDGYVEILNQVFSRNMRHYISEINISDNDPLSYTLLLTDIIFKKEDLIDVGNQHPIAILSAARAHLALHAPVRLRSIITNFVKITITKIMNEVVENVTLTLDLSNKTLGDLLGFLNEDGTFKPWSLKQLIQFLKEHKIIALSKKELSSVLAAIIHQKINEEIHLDIHKKIEERIEFGVHAFLSQLAIRDEFENKHSLLSLTSMIDENAFFISDSASPDNASYFSKLISQFGSMGTITAKDYSHPLVNLVVSAHLAKELGSMITSILSERYKHIANDIILGNTSDTSLSNIGQEYNIYSPEDFSLEMYNRYRSKSGVNLFSASLLREDGQFNDAFLRFHTWFIETKANTLLKALNKAQLILQNINTTILLLNDLIGKIPANSKTILVISNHLTALNNMKDLLDNYSFSKESTSDYAAISTLNGAHLVRIADISRDIQSPSYKAGDNIPGSRAAIVRPILCAMLCIHSSALVLDAKQLDIQINEKIKILPSLKNHAVLEKSDLLSLPICQKLPHIYSQKITIAALIDCVSYWMLNKSIFTYSIPSLINALVSMINSSRNDNNLTNDEINVLKYQVTKGSDDIFSIFQSDDLISQIKACLLVSSDLSATQSSTINFSKLKNLFVSQNNPAASHQVPVQAPLTHAMIMREAQKRLRNLRDPATNVLPIGVTLQTIEAEIRAEQATASSSNRDFVDDLGHVKKSELKPPTGLFSLFTPLSRLEKLLTSIEKRHKNAANFNLDLDDISYLKEQIKLRWLRLLSRNNGNADLAAANYLIYPTRNDNVYVAIAEIIAKHLRASGERSFTYEVLMPDYDKYIPSAMMVHTHLPKAICIDLGIEVVDTSIDDILLTNLITTRTGFPLDISWIINQYIRTKDLINPYTTQPFALEELDDICEHHKGNELLEIIVNKYQQTLTERALNILEDYINEAIFPAGITRNYDTKENDLAFAAYLKFNKRILELNVGERKALLSETIPGFPRTIGQVFEQSQLGSKSLGGASICLTGSGVELARVVIAYKGDSHQIKNKKIVQSASGRHVLAIEPRYYKTELPQDVSSKMSKQEKHLYYKAQSSDINFLSENSSSLKLR